MNNNLQYTPSEAEEEVKTIIPLLKNLGLITKVRPFTAQRACLDFEV